MVTKEKIAVLVQYEELYSKFKAKTITDKEMSLLDQMAFGSEYIESEDKGTIKEY